MKHFTTVHILGAQIRCPQNRYTDAKIGLD